MKIEILAGDAKQNSTKKLVEVIKQKNHHLEVFAGTLLGLVRQV